MTSNKHNKDGVCAICGGKRVPATTTYTVDFGSGVFVARRVPATRCEQCGEEWISDDIAQKLERLVEDAQQKNAEIAVVTMA